MDRTKKTFVGILVLGSLGFLAWAGLSLIYQNRLYPNSRVAGVNTSGLDQAEAQKRIQSAIERYQSRKIRFKYRQKTISFPLDFSQIKFDVSKGVKNALAEQSLAKVLIREPIRVPVEIQEPLKSQLLDYLSQAVKQEKKEEELSFEGGEINYQQAQPGIDLDRERSLLEIEKGLGQLKEVIPLIANETAPSGPYTSLLPAFYQLSDLINSTPIKLTVGNDLLDRINQERLLSWLEIADSPLPSCQIDKGCLLTSEVKREIGGISLKEEAIKNYAKRLAAKLNRPARDAKLAFINGRVAIVSPSQSGFSINQEDLTQKLMDILNTPSSEIKVKAVSKKPRVHKNNIKKLGIKELIGQGRTTFYGSSDKRVHNIRTGAEAISGSLVAPGEVFSTANALGRVNRATGYLPELVIKGDKTVPEYGGGLCQIATTMFRVALSSGMEIVERHNHAYRVGYYEPPVGMDATIYIPSPDMKWRNNTSKWILIQYSLSGYRLAFNFYGTKDNRKVFISSPRVYNIKSPPKPKFIKDPSLKPGQKIKEEGAHPGSDAVFRYRVIKNGEVLIDTKIHSHYQPWAARYRIGPPKKKKSEKNKKEL